MSPFTIILFQIAVHQTGMFDEGDKENASLRQSCRKASLTASLLIEEFKKEEQVIFVYPRSGPSRYRPGNSGRGRKIQLRIGSYRTPQVLVSGPGPFRTWSMGSKSGPDRPRQEKLVCVKINWFSR